ncbi:MAG: hypothetical protein ACI31G_02780, partial [Bacilli bacterium]
HVKEKFPSVKKYIVDCPNEVCKMIYKMTKKNPKERYQNCSEIYEELKKLKDEDVIKEKKGFFQRIFGFK